MPRLGGGYTDLDGSKLKKGNGFLEPNFGVGLKEVGCARNLDHVILRSNY